LRRNRFDSRPQRPILLTMLLNQAHCPLTYFRRKFVVLAHGSILSRNEASSKPGLIQAKVPGAPLALAKQVVDFVQALRKHDLRKKPGIAETLDWISALLQLGVNSLDEDGTDIIVQTLSALVKTQEDR